ncbi:hypothetical protein RZS08_24530, partial [Arthrospira platensis SPKY1]|nr:hypothetical protein [Arthrospira platensis SPKY1]
LGVVPHRVADCTGHGGAGGHVAGHGDCGVLPAAGQMGAGKGQIAGVGAPGGWQRDGGRGAAYRIGQPAAQQQRRSVIQAREAWRAPAVGAQGDAALAAPGGLLDACALPQPQQAGGLHGLDALAQCKGGMDGHHHR